MRTGTRLSEEKIYMYKYIKWVESREESASKCCNYRFLSPGSARQRSPQHGKSLPSCLHLKMEPLAMLQPPQKKGGRGPSTQPCGTPELHNGKQAAVKMPKPQKNKYDESLKKLIAVLLTLQGRHGTSPERDNTVCFFQKLSVRDGDQSEWKAPTLPAACFTSCCLSGTALACQSEGEVSHAVKQKIFFLPFVCFSLFAQQSSGFSPVKSAFFFKRDENVFF